MMEKRQKLMLNCRQTLSIFISQNDTKLYRYEKIENSNIICLYSFSHHFIECQKYCDVFWHRRDII